MPITNDVEGTTVDSNVRAVVVDGVTPREEQDRVLDDASVHEEEEEDLDYFDDEVLGDANVEHTHFGRAETAYLQSRLW